MEIQIQSYNRFFFFLFLLFVFLDFLVILQGCFEQKPKKFTVPELDTAFGLRLSSIFRFHEFFQIQISWMNNWNLFRVNIKCSGWTLNLCFFCETAAGKLQKKMSSNIYFHCILFTRFSCGAIIIICHFLLFVLQSADLHPAAEAKWTSC